jgi:hypothetical protein
MAITAVDARPQRTDVWAYAGDDLTLTLTVRDGSGNAVDLSGDTVAAQVRTSAGALLATFTPSVAGNVVTLVLDHTATALLPPGALWDCQRSDGSGLIQTLITGWFRTTPQVTKP